MNNLKSFTLESSFYDLNVTHKNTKQQRELKFCCSEKSSLDEKKTLASPKI